MNDRAISEQQLLHEFLSYYTNKECNGKLSFVATEIKQHFADLLSDQPTLDVEPVKHGRWIYIRDEENIGLGIHECSECHKRDIHAKDREVPYCWNCGTKMDQTTDEGDNT